MCTFSIDGVILKVAFGSDFDAQIAVLSRRLGRLNLVARRLNRPGKLRGSLLALTQCRFQLRRMTKGGVVLIEECERLAVFPELISSYFRFVCASYISELLLLTVPDRSPCPELYDLLLPTLDSIGKSRGPKAVALATELKILCALGYAPSLSRCVVCSRPQETAMSRFLVGAGGVICADCWSRHKSDYEAGTAVKVSAGVVAFAKMAMSKPIESLGSTRTSHRLARELLRLLSRYKVYHLQLQLNSASVLRRCLGKEMRQLGE